MPTVCEFPVNVKYPENLKKYEKVFITKILLYEMLNNLLSKNVFGILISKTVTK